MFAKPEIPSPEFDYRRHPPVARLFVEMATKRSPRSPSKSTPRRARLKAYCVRGCNALSFSTEWRTDFCNRRESGSPRFSNTTSEKTLRPIASAADLSRSRICFARIAPTILKRSVLLNFGRAGVGLPESLGRPPPRRECVPDRGGVQKWFSYFPELSRFLDLRGAAEALLKRRNAEAALLQRMATAGVVPALISMSIARHRRRLGDCGRSQARPL